MEKQFNVTDKIFSEKGHYDVEFETGYKSRSLFKPEVASYYLKENSEFTAYLDGDAQLIDNKYFPINA